VCLAWCDRLGLPGRGEEAKKKEKEKKEDTQKLTAWTSWKDENDEKDDTQKLTGHRGRHGGGIYSASSAKRDSKTAEGTKMG